jgi:regulator of sirC expression with transglutaminase-like and TPR domain
VKALQELLTSETSKVTLDVAALDLATIEHPKLDPGPWLRELDRLAVEVAERASDLADGLDFLHSMKEFLFEELGFHGNETFYYDPRNSCLNDVLAYRTGIPITLSLLYMEIGRRLEKPLSGIGAPGHFLVGYEDENHTLFIDPYHGGRVMDADECLAELQAVNGVVLDASALNAVSPRQMAVRMLRNLEGAYLRKNSFEKAVQVSDLLRLAGVSSAAAIPRWPSAPN